MKIKKILISLIFTLPFLIGSPVLAAKTVPAKLPAVWKPVAPLDYTAINWVKARGVTSFMKAPDGNGSVDFLTFIYLPYNEIRLISTSTPRVDWGDPQEPFTDTTTRNWAVARVVTEAAKINNLDAKFVWNVPFFNVTATTTDLSMALKSTEATSTYITSGSRPSGDMEHARRMLTIDNKKGVAKIIDFEAVEFASTTTDQAVESFAPQILKTDGTGAATGRLFLGVRADGKELVVFCSQQATPQEAGDALVAAGVPVENQMQADGGGSATCGYNLPGQYFVEPIRTLPYLMGAFSVVGRGIVNEKLLSVRTGPGTKFTKLRQIPKGTAVTIYEEKKGWFRISHSAEWVLGSYVKKSK